ESREQLEKTALRNEIKELQEELVSREKERSAEVQKFAREMADFEEHEKELRKEILFLRTELERTDQHLQEETAEDIARIAREAASKSLVRELSGELGWEDAAGAAAEESPAPELEGEIPIRDLLAPSPIPEPVEESPAAELLAPSPIPEPEEESLAPELL